MPRRAARDPCVPNGSCRTPRVSLAGPIPRRDIHLLIRAPIAPAQHTPPAIAATVRTGTHPLRTPPARTPTKSPAQPRVPGRTAEHTRDVRRRRRHSATMCARFLPVQGETRKPGTIGGSPAKMANTVANSPCADAQGFTEIRADLVFSARASVQALTPRARSGPSWRARRRRGPRRSTRVPRGPPRSCRDRSACGCRRAGHRP